MEAIGGAPRRLAQSFRHHARIIWALLLRELATRYGRDNLGFLWIIAEPLVFCAAVVLLWKAIKPPYEHGLPIIPFVVTGYMPIILVRHMISQAVVCVRSNVSLLYHRQISVLHLFIGRLALEFIGVSLAFAVVVGILVLYGFMDLPKNLFLVYGGWLMLAWITLGTAMILGAIAETIIFTERFIAAFTYIMVPASGTFYMVAWIPPQFRNLVLYLPFIHPVEMVRSGFFGAAAPAYYHIEYAFLWGLGLVLFGLVLIQFVRKRVEIE